MGFKSPGCLSQYILKDEMLLFAFNLLLTDFIRMFWAINIHEHKSLTHKVCSTWDRMMLQYVVIAGLIQFVLHLVQISDVATGKSQPDIITEPSPCFMVDLFQGL